MEQDRTALVVGANGGIGAEAVLALRRHGWRVRALARRPGPDAPGLEWVTGDAMRAEEVVGAATGVQAIVHAVNPPGYRDWDRLVLPMLDASLAAARASGARLVLPGTVYNYGPECFGLLREDAPQRPRTRKGAIRVQMEQRMAAAAGQGVRSLVLRAGDFFGPRPGNNWFTQGLLRGGPDAALSDPGRAGVGHAWAYLPDVAETLAQLLAREAQLADFETFHFGGHWDHDGRRMIQAIGQANGRPDQPVRRFPWALVGLLAPVVPLFREMREMRYLWQEPVQLDNRRLVGLLGAEPHTPLPEAVRSSVAALRAPAGEPLPRGRGQRS